MLTVERNDRGICGIGVWHPKHEVNVGTLLRSAYCFGADFVFTVGQRYRKQASDVFDTRRNLPLYTYADIDDLIAHLPYSCPLVGVEIADQAVPLNRFNHPMAACYLLGAEDHGLPRRVLDRCHKTVCVPLATHCLNVSVAGSIVLYDRCVKRARLTRLEEAAMR